MVRDVDLVVPSGQVLAVLGPNGAGKTTLMLTLAGLLPRLSGSVTVDDRELPGGNPTRAARRGLVLVPDDRALFTNLDVEQNLSVARRRAGASFDELAEIFPSLAARRRVRAGDLSGGEQQMLAVARALVQCPRVLIVDELSMGLAPIVAEELLAAVRRIADETGTTVVLVEQHVSLALAVSDLAVVLVRGRIALRGPAEELALHPARLEAAYLGA
ncbi:ABC transporter ATP-binding protein [Marmoricola sp. RAF53]|uniref:ABC transporter ATP-binding protein n=1 Tax=Marmoricola sp. RAF53 TaxID=3233059 RepID=UPI003F9973CB